MVTIMDYYKVIEEIESLKHFRNICCPECGHQHRVHILQIGLICSKCKKSMKLRGFASIGSEIQDVIDAVLEWIGEGEQFNAVMKRYEEIKNSK
jgi:ribosomal protein L37AE/L43A